MTIAVIGSGGQSGRIFVHAALAAGHNVRAGILHTNPFTDHPNLEIISCDATNKNQLLALLQGAGAVVSLLGHTKHSAPDVQEKSFNAIIEAMGASGLKRIISLTGTGARFPGDKITLADRFLNFGVSHVDPARIKDGLTHVELLKASELEWTILRVLKLQNIKPKPFTLRAHGPTKIIVSRDEVASAILQILEDQSFVHEAPIIAHG